MLGHALIRPLAREAGKHFPHKGRPDDDPHPEHVATDADVRTYIDERPLRSTKPSIGRIPGQVERAEGFEGRNAIGVRENQKRRARLVATSNIDNRSSLVRLSGFLPSQLDSPETPEARPVAKRP